MQDTLDTPWNIFWRCIYLILYMLIYFSTNLVKVRQLWLRKILKQLKIWNRGSSSFSRCLIGFSFHACSTDCYMYYFFLHCWLTTECCYFLSYSSIRNHTLNLAPLYFSWKLQIPINLWHHNKPLKNSCRQALASWAHYRRIFMLRTSPTKLRFWHAWHELLPAGHLFSQLLLSY